MIDGIRLDALKIDLYFVMYIPGDESDAQIAQAIIAMAQSLKLKVVAIGVEIEAQLRFFRERSCDYAQGYRISPPYRPISLRPLCALTCR
jgi:EAL domain-containing protein (putative c-di-GMP-specific phosphodiesterase class I)